MANITFSWDIKLYNRSGGFITAFPKAVNRSLLFALNGIDVCNFSLYLDDPAAVNVMPRSTIVKVWRHISGDYTYSDPSGTPCFAGYVTRTEKRGRDNQMDIVAQSPFWRLQSKFHINNWKLVIDYAGQDTEVDVDTGLPRGWEGGFQDGEHWDISAMCFKVIDLVNHQLGPLHSDEAATGIVKPPGLWTKTITINRGRNIRRGTFVWQEINDILDQSDAGGEAPDLLPEYIDNGSSDLMYFKTALHRGDDVSSSVHFDFCTGSNNLSDFNETDETTPENFANYVWAVGNHDPETRRQKALDYGGTWGIDAVGNYMYLRDSDSDDMRPASGSGTLINQAQADLKRLSDRPVVYSITQAAFKPPFYGLHYTLGDVVMITASKGALSVGGIKQRIYEVTLSLSENCVETAAMRIADDFYSKVPAGP